MTKPNKQQFEHWYVLACTVILVFGGCFLYWYYAIDGVYMNKVYEYRDGVDPMNLKTVKQSYKRNEMVEFESSFCKTRDARTTISWTLANEKLVMFAPSPPRQLPVGCYPDGNGLRTSEVHLVPMDAMYGDHYFVGVATITLPDGRVRYQSYRTETFQVIP